MKQLAKRMLSLTLALAVCMSAMCLTSFAAIVLPTNDVINVIVGFNDYSEGVPTAPEALMEDLNTEISDDVTHVTLEGAAKFSTDPETATTVNDLSDTVKFFGKWEAEFLMTSNEDIPDGIITAYGSYNAYNNGKWVGLSASAYAADTPFRVIRDGLPTSFKDMIAGFVGKTENDVTDVHELYGIPYAVLAYVVQEFSCGIDVQDTDNELKPGTTVTLEMRLYAPRALNDGEVNAITDAGIELKHDETVDLHYIPYGAKAFPIGPAAVKIGSDDYTSIDEAINKVTDDQEITVNTEITIGGTTIEAGSTVTTETNSEAAATTDATTVTPKTLTISKEGEQEKTASAYLISSGTGENVKTAVITDVDFAEESEITNESSTTVANLVNVAQVLANAVAEHAEGEATIDVSSISSMTLRLDMDKTDDTSATGLSQDVDENSQPIETVKNQLIEKLNDTDVIVYDVKPIATVTTTKTEGLTTTTQSYEYDASKQVTGSFTFKLNVGTSADAGRTAYLTHYHNENDNWTATVITGIVDNSGDVTITLNKFSYISLDRLSARPSSSDSPSSSGSYTPAPAVTITDEETPLSEFPIFYVDVAENAWYHDAVAYVTGLGLMEGVGDDRFSPNASTTRGMVAVVMMRLANGEAVDLDSFFDVASDAYYAEAAAWAVENGVYVGFDDGSFRGEINITREQFAAVLYRYAKAKGFDVSGRANIEAYADGDKVSFYARDAVAWTVESGIIEGVGSNLLDPTGKATRAQLATMLMRFHEMTTAKA